MVSRRKCTLPSHRRKLQPPVCRLRNPLTRSLAVRLSPNGSLPLIVDVPGRRFIGSFRGSGARPYWAVTAKTEPYHGWLGSPHPDALQDCSNGTGKPVRTSNAG